MDRKLGQINCNIHALLVLSSLVFAGCSSNNSADPETMVSSTETDSASGLTSSADTDTGNNAGIVGVTDSGTATDQTTGGGLDNTTNVSTTTESETNAGGNVAIDAVTNTGTGDTTGVGTGVDTNTGDTTNTGTGTEPDGMTDTDTDTATDTDAETDTGTTDTGIGEETDTSPITIGASNCPALTATSDAGNIAGLYDLSDTDEQGLVDVMYFSIDENGVVTNYDYQQDDVDQGDNCYLIKPGLSVFSSLGNDKFTVTTYANPNIDCEIQTDDVTIILNDSELSASGPDTDDFDEDGDTTELITDTVPVVSGLTTESFNRCQ